MRRRGAPARASSCMASEVVLYLVGVRLRLRLRHSSRRPPGVALYLVGVRLKVRVRHSSRRPRAWRCGGAVHVLLREPRHDFEDLGARGVHVARHHRVEAAQPVAAPGRGRAQEGGRELRDVLSERAQHHRRTTGDLGRGPQRPQGPMGPRAARRRVPSVWGSPRRGEERRRVSCDAASAAHGACSRTAPRGRRRRARP